MTEPCALCKGQPWATCPACGAEPSPETIPSPPKKAARKPRESKAAANARLRAVPDTDTPAVLDDSLAPTAPPQPEQPKPADDPAKAPEKQPDPEPDDRSNPLNVPDTIVCSRTDCDAHGTVPVLGAGGLGRFVCEAHSLPPYTEFVQPPNPEPPVLQPYSPAPQVQFARPPAPVYDPPPGIRDFVSAEVEAAIVSKAVAVDPVSTVQDRLGAEVLIPVGTHGTPTGSLIVKTGDRMYVDPDSGEAFPSVTTVLDVVGGEKAQRLKAWAAKQAGYRAVQNMAELDRKIRLDGPEAAAKWVAAASREKTEEAALNGSDLHDLAERHQRGEPMPSHMTPMARQMLYQYERFLDAEQPRFYALEMTTLNRTYGFGGTMDACVGLPRYDYLPMVMDYKTGRTGPYKSWGKQMCAYAHGEFVLKKLPNKGPDGSPMFAVEPMPPLSQEKALVLRVRPDYYALHVVDISKQWMSFLSTLEVWNDEQIDVTAVISEPLVPDRGEAWWCERARVCETEAQLIQLFQEASLAGMWSPQLLEVATARRNEILSTFQMIEGGRA